jgi:hypothetical protein
VSGQALRQPVVESLVEELLFFRRRAEERGHVSAKVAGVALHASLGGERKEQVVRSGVLARAETKASLAQLVEKVAQLLEAQGRLSLADSSLSHYSIP